MATDGSEEFREGVVLGSRRVSLILGMWSHRVLGVTVFVHRDELSPSVRWNHCHEDLRDHLTVGKAEAQQGSGLFGELPRS